MGYQRDRDEFISALTRRLSTEPPHIAAAIARRLLRHATTLQRYAEAQCNGDWPFDNGERKTQPCSRCEARCHPAAMRTEKFDDWSELQPGRGDSPSRPTKRTRPICPDCRTQDIVTAILTPYGLKPYFQGDPRGAVFQIFEQHISPELIHNGRERGLYVPAR